MAIVVGGDRDHGQTAANHPHIVNQYTRFILAGARFARLNPDRCYIDYIQGSAVANAVDNPAFAIVDYSNVRQMLEPSGGNGIALNISVPAAICELIDRVESNNVNPQIEEILVSVNEGNLTYSPAFRVLTNCPNPFNQTTRIFIYQDGKYDLELQIFSVNGALVYDESQSINQSGWVEFFWDGRNNNRQRVASGVYLYRVSAGPYCQTRSMLLLK